MSNENTIEVLTRADGKYAWHIIAKGTEGSAVPDQVIATDGSQGYENEHDALQGLFRVFFGAYDMSFLHFHKMWVDKLRELNEDVDENASHEPWTRTASLPDEGDDVTRGGTLGGE